MSRLRYLNPCLIRDAVRDIRKVSSGGGPAKLRLLKVGEPQGVFVPTAEVEFEVVSKDGTVANFKPALPVPWPYAWSYRLARLLRVPLVRSYKPEWARVEVPVPRRSG